ncbi:MULTISPECIES: hypothetical protein [Methylobacterium]|uniref:Phage tail protein n=3 Tax=Pseudomonadota TaxID=1224 RepID=A0ABQ4T0J4_9HYPH|nr:MULTISPECIES: hypothetical protein [Methylobacterium]GBU19354.1 hypothetical protein AwMethylo_35690 [Methylobacterium sp.]GJE08617.1 hypothetical protein AOPFMNJM_3960 [Methylobacterium jeotgali]
MSAMLRIQDGTAVEVVEMPSGVAPEALYTPEFRATLVPKGGAEVGYVLDDKGKLIPPPEPEAGPAPVVDVTRAQAKIALHRAGYLDQVKVLVEEEGGEVAIWFAEANMWQRANPHVETLGAALGLSAAQIDDLFRLAAQIQA